MTLIDINICSIFIFDPVIKNKDRTTENNNNISNAVNMDMIVQRTVIRATLGIKSEKEA